MRYTLLFLLSVWVSPFAVAQDLAGAWELVSGEYIDAEGELVNYGESDLQSVKILSATHFSFTSMKGRDFWAAGTGTYQLANGQYTETLQLNSFAAEPGTTFTFDTRVEDGYWYNSRWEEDKRVEYEVWRQVE